jgi:hypothetical protein
LEEEYTTAKYTWWGLQRASYGSVFVPGRTRPIAEWGSSLSSSLSSAAGSPGERRCSHHRPQHQEWGSSSSSSTRPRRSYTARLNTERRLLHAAPGFVVGPGGSLTASPRRRRAPVGECPGTMATATRRIVATPTTEVVLASSSRPWE